MLRKNIVLKIDSSSRSVEYVLVEGFKLTPDHYFHFDNGDWVAKLDNFPIQDDNDIDILIIVKGSPLENSSLDVTVDGQLKTTIKLYKPFNSNGYGQFNTQIAL